MPEEKHAFLSYVGEDGARADEVQEALEAVGVKVWRDRDALGPGDVWETRIRKAIQEHSLAFVALISSTSVSKPRSYQRPELLLAADEYRLRPPEAHWLFPVRLDDCPLPELDLGGARGLTALQWTDLFGPRSRAGLVRLTVVVRDLLREEQQVSTPVVDVLVGRPTPVEGRKGRPSTALLDAQLAGAPGHGPLLAYVNQQRTFDGAPWMASAIAMAGETGQPIDDAFVRAVELHQVPNRLTPLGDLLHRRLRPAFSRSIPDDGRYTELFDRASVLFDAASLDLARQNNAQRYLPAYPGFGPYTWRYRHVDPPLEVEMTEALTPQPPELLAGRFGGDPARARKAYAELVELVPQVRRR